MSERDRHIPPGNRGPRVPKGPRSTRISSTEALTRVKDRLMIGPTPNVVMRRQVIPIDRQRYYRLRDRLVAAGAVVYSDQTYLWDSTDRLEQVTVEQLYGELEPRFGPSNTHPGEIQVDCPFCGLFSKTFEDKRSAAAWYYNVHLKKGLAHS